MLLAVADLLVRRLRQLGVPQLGLQPSVVVVVVLRAVDVVVIRAAGTVVLLRLMLLVIYLHQVVVRGREWLCRQLLEVRFSTAQVF